MSSHRWLYAILTLGAIGAVFALKSENESKKPPLQSPEVKKQSYYTCPMHPEVHQDHEGLCPICHMKLVKAEITEDRPFKSGSLSLGDHDLTRLGLKKIEVETMNLHIKIPISGRAVGPKSVAFQVYESDFSTIAIGQEFIGATAALNLRGKISHIDPFIDPASRTLRVVGLLHSSEASLLHESTFSGHVDVVLKSRLAIPENSVLFTGNEALVYVFDEQGQLTSRAVKLGQKADGYFEVTEGLRAGELISSGPNFLVDSEARIQSVGHGTHH